MLGVARAVVAEAVEMILAGRNTQVMFITNYTLQCQQLPTTVPGMLQAAEACVADRGVWPADAARLAADADIVVVTCHQDSENRGMVGQAFLSHCKEGVRIVNVARGAQLGF